MADTTPERSSILQEDVLCSVLMSIDQGRESAFQRVCVTVLNTRRSSNSDTSTIIWSDVIDLKQQGLEYWRHGDTVLVKLIIAEWIAIQELDCL